MAELPVFSIELTPTSMLVKQNGQDISEAVQGIRVTKPDGYTVPVVELELRSELVRGDVAGLPVQPSAPIADWLDAIDPDELSKEALASSSFGENYEAVLLRILKERAIRGD